MTSATELYNYMKKHENEIRNDLKFLGVYASNTLPKNLSQSDLKRGICCIFNYDPNYKPGSHWVAVRIKDGVASWFDSYGLPPDEKSEDDLLNDNTHFKKWLQTYSKKKIIWNPYDFQSLYTEVCGLYSVYFCLNGGPTETENPYAWRYFYKNKSIKFKHDHPVPIYSKHKERNDKIIKTLVSIKII